MRRKLHYNGNFPKELTELAEKWSKAGKEFYLGPENVFEYSLITMNYVGSEAVPREWGSWSIHTENCPTSIKLSKDNIDDIAFCFGKKYGLRSAILWIGSKCNLRCNFCLYHGKLKKLWEEEYSHECCEIEIDILKKRIDKLSKLGVEDIEFVPNGEPFLYSFLFELIKYTKAKGINSRIIFTNGTVLTEEIILRLKALELQTISVSLNAFSFEVWSKVSNSSNLKLFKTAIASPIIARKHGIQTEVSFAVCQENKDEVKLFLEYWLDKVDILKVCHQYIEEDLLLKNKNVNNVSLPYYICSDLRGRIVVSNSGDIIPCCTAYNAMDNDNSHALPIINIDTLEVNEIISKIDKSYKDKAYKSICLKCSSLRIPKSDRKKGYYFGIKGETTGNFFFANTK